MKGKLYSEHVIEKSQSPALDSVEESGSSHFSVTQMHLNSYSGWRFFANRCRVEPRDHMGIRPNLRGIVCLFT